MKLTVHTGRARRSPIDFIPTHRGQNGDVEQAHGKLQLLRRLLRRGDEGQPIAPTSPDFQLGHTIPAESQNEPLVLLAQQMDERDYELLVTALPLAEAYRQDSPGSAEAIKGFLQELSPEDAEKIARALNRSFLIIADKSRPTPSVDETRSRLRSVFQELKDQHVTPEDLSKVLDSLSIEPVLTAHPTEARTDGTLFQLGRLRDEGTRAEAVELLWRSPTVRSERPHPLDEVAHALGVYGSGIFKGVADFYRLFDEELESCFGIQRKRPVLSFAGWAGGDRDGNPHVDPEVSKAAVEMQRAYLRDHYVAELNELAQELSLKKEYAETLRALADSVSAGDISPETLIQKLQEIRNGLIQLGALETAKGRIAGLMYQVETFGFHLAELDFRDSSDKIWANEGAEIRDELRAIKDIQRKHGPQAANHYIISMTHQSSDLLEVLRIAQEEDLSALHVVPLLETNEDMRNSERVMDEAWSHPTYLNHLESLGMVQEVMVGYSDSMKEGGLLAAAIRARGTLLGLKALAAEKGIQLRVFHGKGGTDERANGPSHEGVRVQPGATPGAHLRITEQGEVVYNLYADPETTLQTLVERTLAVLEANCLPQPSAIEQGDYDDALAALAQTSEAAYLELLSTPGFMEYFANATPADLAQDLNLGSRPVKRQKHDGGKPRAITWVSAWRWADHWLPGWYGVGSGLQHRIQDHGAEELRAMYQKDPWFKWVLDSAARSAAQFDPQIAREYAELVPTEETRETMWRKITAEHQLTMSTLAEVVGHKPEAVAAANGNDAQLTLLHHLQAHFLPQLRAARETSGSEAEMLLKVCTTAATAIAAATGAVG